MQNNNSLTLLNQKVYFDATPVYSTTCFSYKTEGGNTSFLVLLIPNKTSTSIPPYEEKGCKCKSRHSPSGWGQSRAGPGRREPGEAADSASEVTFLVTSVSSKLLVTFFVVNFYTLTGFKSCPSVIGE